MTWQCGEQKIRQLWDIDPTVAFLNHGSYGAVPRAVQHFRLSVLQQIEKNPVDFLARRLPEKIAEQRLRLARWLNADVDGLVFVSNATAGIGAVLSSLEWYPGDEILFHTHGYGWVRQALTNLSNRKGVIVREAQVPWPVHSPVQIVEAFERELNGRTKLVLCDHISSPTALVFPLQDIVALARKRNIPVLVDGAHAPGSLPLDLEQVSVEFYTGNLHKWVGAPRGCAFLYVHKDYRDRIRPESLSYSGGVTHHNYDQQMQGFFEWTGTQDFSAWLSASAALDFNELLGWEELYLKRNSLLLEARKLFLDTLALEQTHFSHGDLHATMLTLEWPLLAEISPTPQLARALSEELLQKNRVEVPVLCLGHRLCFRISVQAYNRVSDYERLAESLVAHRFSAVRKGVGRGRIG
ncbi:MAG: aminotransferase class V-fold PLP-dependent enzyme [Betaproteobacteria bacterium]|nr:aminotransferase class V-fold PLP-dependent enzyme [Betaproteobacteria bacterium]